MAKKCIICRVFPATVPDRYSGLGRLTFSICEKCHSKRLRGDMIEIIQKENTKREYKNEIKIDSEG